MTEMIPADAARKFEGSNVAFLAAKILDDMPGNAYWSHQDEETWRKWEEAVEAVRVLGIHLYGQGNQIKKDSENDND